MYKGQPTKGINFYNLLLDSVEFTSELGKVALASGKLEAVLINFLGNNKVKGNYDKAPLGYLVTLAERNKLFDVNMINNLKIGNLIL